MFLQLVSIIISKYYPNGFDTFAPPKPQRWPCILSAKANPHCFSLSMINRFKPGQTVNRSSNWRMSSAHSILGTNRIRSSAYCTSLNSSCPSIMPWISCLLRIVTAIISAGITNKYGDDGSPCLTPLCNSQYGVQIRLFNTQLVMSLSCFLPSYENGPKYKSIQAF